MPLSNGSMDGLSVAGGDTLPVIFLFGPTACGKTDLAAWLYARGCHELINVDSAQVFRGMDIGTAKPDAAYRAKIPHYLIDVREPDQSYSAAEFCADAAVLIRQIHSRGKIPVLVGGTSFYFHALEQGLSRLPAKDDAVRNRIEGDIEQVGLLEMHRRLARIDAATAARIHPADRQRVQRALEIAALSGVAPSQLMRRQPGTKLAYPLLKLALFDSSRAQLHQRIAARFEAMLAAGLVDEVAQLQNRFTHLHALSSMRTVGYRQVLDYLNAQIDYATMVERAVSATRQLAKRQLTWLRRQSNVTWFDRGQRHLTRTLAEYLDLHPMLLYGGQCQGGDRG